MLGSLGYTYAVSGHETEAQAVLTSLQDETRHNVPALTLAFIYAGLGQNDSAFEWLDKAYVERFGWLIFLNVDPKFDNLRSDPRFTTLLQRLKLK